VEYALEAVKQGSAAVGLKSNTHAILLALKVSVRTGFADAHECDEMERAFIPSVRRTSWPHINRKCSALMITLELRLPG